MVLGAALLEAPIPAGDGWVGPIRVAAAGSRGARASAVASTLKSRTFEQGPARFGPERSGGAAACARLRRLGAPTTRAGRDEGSKPVRCIVGIVPELNCCLASRHACLPPKPTPVQE
jgi:hypothetical protein